MAKAVRVRVSPSAPRICPGRPWRGKDPQEKASKKAHMRQRLWAFCRPGRCPGYQWPGHLPIQAQWQCTVPAFLSMWQHFPGGESFRQPPPWAEAGNGRASARSSHAVAKSWIFLIGLSRIDEGEQPAVPALSTASLGRPSRAWVPLRSCLLFRMVTLTTKSPSVESVGRAGARGLERRRREV